MSNFSILPGADDSPVILHVPHSSRVIPPDVRAGIVLDDDALALELDLMTDADTDLLAARAAGSGAWRFVNLLSRLVVDPERFPDDREQMLRVGMGAVYTRTATGAHLREHDPALVGRFFDPYARAFADLVDERIAATGRAVIVDVHSYPLVRLPYELGGAARPAICLGTDARHTPPWLVELAHDAFAACGDVAENTPFEGCYIPLRHYGVDDRVSGIMVELRRDFYRAEPGLSIVARGLATLAGGGGRDHG